MIAITNRDPRFLKRVYTRQDIELVDHERFIRSGAKFISFDPDRIGQEWRVWRMHPKRVPIPLGAVPSLESAEYLCRKP